MSYKHILFAIEDSVATLVLNRPEKLNALSQHTLKEMLDAIDETYDAKARALLLKGAGRAFCSGADLASGAEAEDKRNDAGAGLEQGFNPVLERLVRLPAPVIAAVGGVAAGGGCGLALACDIVIASRSAYFLQPFMNIGLVPDVGSTWLMPRLAGKARANAMMLLGERIPAETAVQWGLIYKMVEDEALEAEATAMAARLAAGPTVALALAKQGLAAAMTQTLSETLAMERVNQKIAGRSADHAEGVAAFMEKRKPVFQGR